MTDPAMDPHSSSISRKRAKLIDHPTESRGPPSASSSFDPDIRDGIITNVKLTNFMNHESLNIKFHHRVNVLCGSNGAGKSSVLQAIVLGLGKIYVSLIPERSSYPSVSQIPEIKRLYLFFFFAAFS